MSGTDGIGGADFGSTFAFFSFFGASGSLAARRNERPFRCLGSLGASSRPSSAALSFRPRLKRSESLISLFMSHRA